MRWWPTNFDLTEARCQDNQTLVTAEPAVDKNDLPNIEQEQYVLSQSAALSLGFQPIGLEAGANRVVVVAGMSRYKEVPGEGPNERLRYGAALRIAVSASNVSVDVAASLPILAAKAQLGQVQTQTSLSLRGYTGPLKLPQFGALDVDNYSDYLKAVSQFQDLITNSSDGISPVLLARAADPETVEDDLAAAAFWALSEIARGKRLAEAIERFPDRDEQRLLEKIRQVYQTIGANADDPPKDIEQAKARDHLHGVALRGGWPWGWP